MAKLVLVVGEDVEVRDKIAYVVRRAGYSAISSNGTTAALHATDGYRGHVSAFLMTSDDKKFIEWYLKAIEGPEVGDVPLIRVVTGDVTEKEVKKYREERAVEIVCAPPSRSAAPNWDKRIIYSLGKHTASDSFYRDLKTAMNQTVDTSRGDREVTDLLNLLDEKDESESQS